MGKAVPKYTNDLSNELNKYHSTLAASTLNYIFCRNGGNFQRITFLKEKILSFVKENTASIRIFSNILFLDM
jgi:hypothetical protein